MKYCVALIALALAQAGKLRSLDGHVQGPVDKAEPEKDAKTKGEQDAKELDEKKDKKSDKEEDKEAPVTKSKELKKKDAKEDEKNTKDSAKKVAAKTDEESKKDKSKDVEKNNEEENNDDKKGDGAQKKDDDQKDAQKDDGEQKNDDEKSKKDVKEVNKKEAEEEKKQASKQERSVAKSAPEEEVVSDGSWQDFLPTCRRKLKGLIKKAEVAYSPPQVEGVLEAECDLDKQFPAVRDGFFDRKKECKAFAHELAEARAAERRGEPEAYDKCCKRWWDEQESNGKDGNAAGSSSNLGRNFWVFIGLAVLVGLIVAVATHFN